MHLNAKHRCSDAQKRSHSHIDWVISISLSCCLVWASLGLWNGFVCDFCALAFPQLLPWKSCAFQSKDIFVDFKTTLSFYFTGLFCSSVTSEHFLLFSTSPSPLSLFFSLLPHLTSTHYVFCSAVVHICVMCKCLQAKSKHLLVSPAESALHLLKLKAERVWPRVPLS